MPFFRCLALILFGCWLCPCPALAGPTQDAAAGYKALEQGEYDKGIELLTKALDSGKLSASYQPIAYYNRGNAWYHKKEFAKALADLDEALAKNPSFAEAMVKRGQVKKDKGDLAGAMDDLHKAVALSPENPKAYFVRGLLYALDGDATKAMEDFADASRLDPRFVVTPLLEAVLAVGNEIGIKFMTKAIESDKLGPTNLALTYYFRGRAWYALGGYEQAVNDFTNAIVQNPSLFPAYAARGDIWKEREQYLLAAADYSHALSLHPYNATLHYNRGFALSLVGNNTQAAQDFHLAHELDPSLEIPDIETLLQHQTMRQGMGPTAGNGTELPND
ncbi:tetratricopeptide repeat protein [Megalodesulfovibrio paquesii]